MTFGCVVTLEDDNEKMFRFWIVGVDESDPEGRISYRSPVGGRWLANMSMTRCRCRLRRARAN